jgi:hypothetical protein
MDSLLRDSNELWNCELSSVRLCSGHRWLMSDVWLMFCQLRIDYIDFICLRLESVTTQWMGIFQERLDRHSSSSFSGLLIWKLPLTFIDFFCRGVEIVANQGLDISCD